MPKSKTKLLPSIWKMLLVIITGDESVNENRNKSLSARKSKKCWHLYKALTHLHSAIDPINAKTKEKKERKINDIKQLPLKVFREWPEIRHTFSLNEKTKFRSWFMDLLKAIHEYIVLTLFHSKTIPFPCRFFIRIAEFRTEMLKYFRNVPCFLALQFFSLCFCFCFTCYTLFNAQNKIYLFIFLLFISALLVIIEPQTLFRLLDLEFEQN